jgi:hypothetical protein
VQLEAAVATDASENISRETLGVDTHQNVRLAGRLTLDERDVSPTVVGLVADGLESTEGGRDPCLGNTVNELL